MGSEVAEDEARLVRRPKGNGNFVRIGHREWNIAGGRDGRDGWGEEYEEVSGAPSEPDCDCDWMGREKSGERHFPLRSCL